MTSEHDSHGPDPDAGRVDPVYDALFRPSDVADDSAPPAPAEAVPSAPTPAAPGAAAAQPVADTGRLFRSQGVDGHADTVLALDSGRFSRLRTLDRVTGDAAPVAAPAVVVTSGIEREPAAEDLAVAAMLAPPPASVYSPPGEPVPSDAPRRQGRRMRTSRSMASGGLRAGGVYLIVIGVTVIVGFANALLGGGALGWPTGVALLVSSVYAAIAVRPEDDTSAFLIPPVAFLIAALTAGQAFLDAGEGSILNRAVIVFFSLADNWLWVIGSTLIALVIVLVRRRR